VVATWGHHAVAQNEIAVGRRGRRPRHAGAPPWAGSIASSPTGAPTLRWSPLPISSSRRPRSRTL